MFNSKFIGAFASYKNMPKTKGEVAFIGRSNVGKSSLINMLTGIKGIAKVSSTPGKTQTLNLYSFDKTYLVDLPGYGYAAKGKSNNIFLSTMIKDYLTKREELKRIYILIDCRIPIQKIDIGIIELLETFNKNYSIIVTKVDKISKTSLLNFMKTLTEFLSNIVSQEIKCYTSSSEKKVGKDDIINSITSEV